MVLQDAMVSLLLVARFSLGTVVLRWEVTFHSKARLAVTSRQDKGSTPKGELSNYDELKASLFTLSISYDREL